MPRKKTVEKKTTKNALECVGNNEKFNKMRWKCVENAEKFNKMRWNVLEILLKMNITKIQFQEEVRRI